MKVEIKSGAQWIPVSMIDEVNYIIETLKEDCTPIEELIRMSANAVDGYGSTLEVYSASAVVSKNINTWNYYSDKSGDLDVWLEGAVLTYEGFYIIGAYLSDIWAICPNGYDEFRGKISLTKFKEVM